MHDLIVCIFIHATMLFYPIERLSILISTKSYLLQRFFMAKVKSELPQNRPAGINLSDFIEIINAGETFVRTALYHLF